MKTVEMKLIATGVLFFLMLITGVFVKKAGKPYPVFLLSIHKILSLLAAVATVITVVQMYKKVDASFWIWALMVITGLFFLLSFTSGTILTTDKDNSGQKEKTENEAEPMKRMHVIAPILTTILAALTFFLMY
ncbi:MAG: hypothetical protein K9H26_19030 [Prolixibacteraceae bacterium]|nr:hypothetical protein [Prolixibacteraceae bacterium]